MKQFIYFDQDSINSALAQIGSGYINSINNTQEERATESSSNKNSYSADAGIEAIFSGKLSTEAGSSTTESNTKTQTDLMNKIIGDYSLDVLLDQVNEWNTDINKSKEGDFINIQESIQLLNLDTINKITNPEDVNRFINHSSKEYKELIQLNSIKSKLSSQMLSRKNILTEKFKSAEFWENLYEFSKYGKLLFNDTQILSLDSGLAFLNKDSLRLNNSTLYMLSTSNRKPHILGQVMSIQETVHSDGNIPDLESNELGTVPQFITEILLGSFDLLKENDRIILPLAIYFE